MKEKFSPDPIYVRLKEVLKAKTDRQLATMLEVTPQSVGGWKRSGKVKRETLKSVASLTGVSYAWLLTGEGEKFSSKNAKPLEQTQAVLRECVALSVSSAPLLFNSLPVVAELNKNKLLTTQDKRTMALPNQVCSDDAAVIEILSEDWSDEGLHTGDLLIVEPLNSTDPNGRLVVAIHDGKAIIRRFEQRGQLAHFTALQSGPVFSFPIENVRVAYLLKGVFNPKP